MAEPAKIIIVHTADHVRAALAAALEVKKSVTLQSAPEAIFYAGGLYLRNMFEQAKAAFPKVRAIFIIDCAETGAEAVGAMQSGHTHVRSSASAEIRAKLADIAKQLHAKIITAPYRQLDLRHEWDAKAACRKWLGNS